MLLAQKNIPSAFDDKVNLILPSISPDSKIAKKYKMDKSRASCIVIVILASYFLQQTVDIMKLDFDFSSTDSCNDPRLEKTIPLTVRLFDINASSVDTQFLNICCTADQTSGTAAKISQKLMMFQPNLVSLG